MTVAALMHNYNALLEDVDRQFQRVRARHAPRISCGKGCARCCCGLFDVSLPDAVRLAGALDQLSENMRAMVAARASVLHSQLLQAEPQLETPFFLQALPPDRIDRLVESIPDARCPFLDDQDHCLVYPQRPLACRLEGLPMVDIQDGLFGDWCALNFRVGVTPELEADVRRDYYGMQAVEREATALLTQYLCGRRQEDVTLMIPSVVAAFDSFWRPRLISADGAPNSWPQNIRVLQNP